MSDELLRGAWVQDPSTYKLIPREQYERQVARSKELAAKCSRLSSPQVIRDIEPFRNVAVDGAVISSRSAKREMMKRNDLIELGNEKRVTQRQIKRRTPVVQSIKRALQELRSR